MQKDLTLVKYKLKESKSTSTFNAVLNNVG